VIVCVRDSDCETNGVLERSKRDSLLSTTLKIAVVQQPGSIPARAEGTRLAKGDIVCFTDDDSRPHPDWLERIEEHYEDPQVGGVGGQDIVYLHGVKCKTDPRKAIGKVQWFGRLIGEHHQGSFETLEVDHLKSVNMSCRRKCLDPFDESLIGSVQLRDDTDISLTMKGKGFKIIYDPEIKVDHFPGVQFSRGGRGAVTEETVYELGFNSTYVLLKHLPPLRRFLFLIYFFGMGDTGSPGIVKGFELAAKNKSLGPLRFLVPATRGKLHGWRQYCRHTGLKRREHLA